MIRTPAVRFGIGFGVPALLVAWSMVPLTLAADPPRDGPLALTLRSRVASPGLGGECRVVETAEAWDPKRTAIIVCDMWDLHHCLNAVRRETEIAARMETVLNAARDRGVTIIHAPSSCMDAYNDHPARARAKDTPRSKDLPAGIESWCKKIPAEEQASYPVDQTDGGEDDDPVEHAQWASKLAEMGRDPRAPWKSQTAALTIDPARDYVSDDGKEIWNVLEDRGVANVILMGVHANMCVLGRPFGLRQMAKNGKHVVLMRDLTDTMYNPQKAPYVSHFGGTDRVVAHVERYVCPSASSDQIVGGKALRLSTDTRPRVVFLIAEDEYKTESTLPRFADAWLARDYHLGFVFDRADDPNTLTGASALDGADVLVVSSRRRAFPKAQLAAVKRHVAAGKAVVGIRTASHAFVLRSNATPPAGHAVWSEFDAEVLGGHYTNHHPAGPEVKVTPHGETVEADPILTGVDPATLASPGTLYKVRPLAASARALLDGSTAGAEAEPVAWTNLTTAGGRVFYTSLGHPDDFARGDFPRLLRNAIDWSAGREIARKIDPTPSASIAFPK